MRCLLFAAAAIAVMAMTCECRAAQTAAEKAMAQQIGRELKQSGQLHNYRIGVKFEDGVAWLSGSVANRSQLLSAVRLAENIRGVDHVVSRLTIAEGPTGPDDGRQYEVQQSLLLSGQTSGTGRRQAAQPTEPQFSQTQFGYGQQPWLQPRQDPRPQRVAQPVQRRTMPPMRRNNTPRPLHRVAARPMPNPTMVQPASTCYGCEDGSYGGGMGGYAGGIDGGYGMDGQGYYGAGVPAPSGFVPGGSQAMNYDNAYMPGYAWPSYSAYPNYAALSYPRQYSPTAWPYIGPFYPYPQVPLGWRKVALEWDDGWWFLDFSDCGSNH